MQISFILVEPAVPQNIGAAARAINTMGFSDLRLVNPANHLSDEARWLAHGSTEILEKSRIYKKFSDATEDLEYVIGTTAKKRSAKYDYYTPEEAKKLLIDKTGIVSRAGIVFGREESGLKNSELAKCDIASSIPLKKPFPSLNLAQSVMLYAYIFSDFENRRNKPTNENTEPLYKELKVKTIRIMDKLNIEKDSVLYGRILERLAVAGEDDVRLFLSFAKNLNRLFE